MEKNYIILSGNRIQLIARMYSLFNKRKSLPQRVMSSLDLKYRMIGKRTNWKKGDHETTLL